VAENARTATGATVASLLSGHASDVDPRTKLGIAVTGLAAAGTWQYAASGNRWVAIQNVSASHALLLPVTYRVRYLPAANERGSFALLFSAWDGSAGKPKGYLDTTQSGDGAAVSARSALAIAPVTDNGLAPAWVQMAFVLPPLLPGTSS